MKRKLSISHDEVTAKELRENPKSPLSISARRLRKEMIPRFC